MSDVKYSFGNELSCRKLLFDTMSVNAGNLVRIVVGNESCDLDSAACAIGYAKFLRVENMRIQTRVIILPLLNTFKKDLVIKTEVAYCMKRFNIDENSVLFRDDIPRLLQFQSFGILEVILVDHHANPFFHESVIQVFDHHKILGPLNFDGYAKTRIETVGSCSSIILDEIFSRSTTNWIADCPEVAFMLYGSILLDTNNLSEATKRYAPLDLKMVDAIEPIVLNLEKKTRFEIYNHLLTVKSDIKGMSPFDLLRKDCKETSDLIICSLPVLVQSFCKLEKAEASLQSFCESTKMKELVLIGLQIIEGSDGNTMIRKDIGFYYLTDATRIEHLVQGLSSLMEPNLKMTKTDAAACNIKSLQIFDMNNLLITRKHVLPAIGLLLSSS